jgi:serine incorporator 1/3
MAIAAALWFQYYVGPGIVSQSGWMWKVFRAIPGAGKMMYHAWYDDCEQYKDDSALMRQCAGNAGVYRPTFLAALFFGTSAIATRFAPALNREAWPAKYAIYGFALLISSE